MSDSKFFSKTKVHELKAELLDNRDTKNTRKLSALQKILANMTMGQDMSLLFNEVINCLSYNNIEMKRLVYLYLQHYAKQKPDLSIMVMNSLTKDIQDINPLVQVMALKTIPFIASDKTTNSFTDVLRKALQEKNPYVKKSAVMCVVKITHSLALSESDQDKEWVIREGLLDIVRSLVHDPSPAVMTCSLTAISQISEVVQDVKLEIDFVTASKIATALNDCIEWHQIQVLEYLLNFIPGTEEDALSISDKVANRLQHSNSGIVLATARLILYLSNWFKEVETKQIYVKKILSPMITLLNHFPEVQYVVLKNILLIIQQNPTFLSGSQYVKSFFVKYNDPIYVKLTKLEILVRIVDEESVPQVVTELKEYSQEVDIEFARKSVRSIGVCAMKVESMASKCINALVELAKTQISYIVQEVIVVMKDLFRTYPNKYEGLISQLCEHLSTIEEPEAKASMIWIVGQYSDRIENSLDVLQEFYNKWDEEPYIVKLAILIAIVKSFFYKSKIFEAILKDILKKCSESCENPDIRDRGLMYWRMISKNPKQAKSIVLKEKPAANIETADLDENLIMELIFYFGTLPSITTRTPKSKIKYKRKGKGYIGNEDNGPLQVNLASIEVDDREVLSPDGGFMVSPVDESNFLNKYNQYYDTNSNSPAKTSPSEYFLPQDNGPTITTTNDDSGEDDIDPRDISSTKSIRSVPSIRRDIWLTSDIGNGLSIEGYFTKQSSSLTANMSITNMTISPIQNFALFFDKNHFGLSPSVIPNANLPLGQTADFKFEIIINPAKVLKKDTYDNFNVLKAAISTNKGSTVFSIKVPLKYLTLVAPLQLNFEKFILEAKELATQGLPLIKSQFPIPVIKQTIPSFDESGLYIVNTNESNVCLHLLRELFCISMQCY
eukprot:NODE_3_length_80033_cov_0.932970.p3 type:complete len:895 gc:universal NODE_3_length_80033_cov_0.932970:52215-54899(+)